MTYDAILCKLLCLTTAPLLIRCICIISHLTIPIAFVSAVLDHDLGNTVHINKEARERRLEAEHRRMMELRSLGIEDEGSELQLEEGLVGDVGEDLDGDIGNMSIHKTADISYSKGFALGSDIIDVPRAYSSGRVLVQQHPQSPVDDQNGSINILRAQSAGQVMSRTGQLRSANGEALHRVLTPTLEEDELM